MVIPFIVLSWAAVLLIIIPTCSTDIKSLICNNDDDTLDDDGDYRAQITCFTNKIEAI